MAHDCQGHTYTHALHRSLWIAVFFMLLEVAGGWYAHSLALISDAMHLFTDVGALLLGIIVARVARWPATPKMSYGYHRAEILGALVSAASLWALSGVLICESIYRFFQPQVVDGPIVFYIATAGLIANFWMMKILHPSQDQSLNVRAAYLHVLGDLLGSIGVVISGIVLWTLQWNFIDPLITIVFTLTILRSSGKVIRQTIGILMESTPEEVDPGEILEALKKVPGVEGVHDLHIWSASHHKIVLSAHLVADTQSDALAGAHRMLEDQFGIRHMTIQVEDPKSFEPKYCYDCENKL